MSDYADRAVKKIIEDLTDRAGLQNEWENINEETQMEIEATWSTIIRTEFVKRDDTKEAE